MPDVFVPTSTTVDFEDATSVTRSPHLCAARVGDWTLVVDVACRLAVTPCYLAETSAATDLHFVRIADEPVFLHYRNGQQALAGQGPRRMSGDRAARRPGR